MHTPSSLLLTRKLRSFAFGLFSVVGLLSTGLAAPVKFEIPAQPAPAALMAFSKQARVEVVFSSDDLKAVRANEVIGAYEPEAALGLLLKDTGFIAQRNSAGKFMVKAAAPMSTTGTVKGSLVGEGGRGQAGVLVTIRETAQSAETDRFGEYVFPQVTAGTYVLVANAPGYQPLHITGVQVRAGRELMLGKEELRKAKEGPLALEPFVVHADAVTELDPYEVTGAKEKPFANGNMDIPRTINDAQPYYVFDSRMIADSGAVNIQDFLKQRLTMNTVALSNSQVQAAAGGVAGTGGNTSAINLRGLGTDKTLILVNGRRQAGVTLAFSNGSALSEGQPDVNGIPTAAIERIEVMPSSASGIYGGSAIGGVINIILKRNYRGGEIQLGYANTFDSDSPTRNINVSYGLSAEKGRTNIFLSASATDFEPLLLQDRLGAFRRGFDQIYQRSPNFILGGSLFLGSLPNISVNTGGTNPPNLVLKNGVSIGSTRTFVSAGTSPTTSLTDLYAGLLANAGRTEITLPPSSQSPFGLLRPFGVTPETRAFRLGATRRMTDRLELQVEAAHNRNKSTTISGTGQSNYLFTYTAADAGNPFQQPIVVTFPTTYSYPYVTESVADSVTASLLATLPRDWKLQADVSFSKSTYDYEFTAGRHGAPNGGREIGGREPVRRHPDLHPEFRAL